MKPEYEARFLDIDRDRITTHLTTRGGRQVMARTLMRRAVHAAAAALHLDLAVASYGSVDEVYLKVLGRDILAESSLTFAGREER